MSMGIFGMMGVTKYSGAAVLEAPRAMVERHRRSHDMGSIRIPLHSRKNPGLFAIVDEADAERVSQYRWYPHGKKGSGIFYARAAIYPDGVRDFRHKTTLEMHRFILELRPGDPAIDHVNHDGLDNRRSNLRLCTNSQNQANRRPTRQPCSSRYRGVMWQPQSKKWHAQINFNGRRKHLGLFDSEAKAALAYNIAAQEVWGEFASLNKVETNDYGVEADHEQ